MSANAGPHWTNNRRRGRPRTERTLSGNDHLAAVASFEEIEHELPPMTEEERHIALAYFTGRHQPDSYTLSRAVQKAPERPEAFQRALCATMQHEEERARKWAYRLRKRYSQLLHQKRADIIRVVSAPGFSQRWSDAVRQAEADGYKTIGEWREAERQAANSSARPSP